MHYDLIANLDLRSLFCAMKQIREVCEGNFIDLSTSMINHKTLTLEIFNYKLVVVLSLAQHMCKITAEPKFQIKTISYSNLKLFNTVASGLQAQNSVQKFNAPTAPYGGRSISRG